MNPIHDQDSCDRNPSQGTRVCCRNTPINGTEVMGVDQVFQLGEIYNRVFSRQEGDR